MGYKSTIRMVHAPRPPPNFFLPSTLHLAQKQGQNSACYTHLLDFLTGASMLGSQLAELDRIGSQKEGGPGGLEAWGKIVTPLRGIQA